MKQFQTWIEIPGVYQIENEPLVYVDISSISSLQDQFVDENLVLGAGLSLQQTMTIFEKQMRNEDFAYLRDFHKHLELVANVPVKNVSVSALEWCLMFKSQNVICAVCLMVKSFF